MRERRWLPYAVMLVGVSAVSWSAILIREAQAPALIIASYRLVLASIPVGVMAAIQHRRPPEPVTSPTMWPRLPSAPFLAAPPTAHPKAGEVLSALTGAGLRLALISNTGFTSGDIYRRWFDDIGWRDRFEVTTFSNEAAVAKPTASIFTSTLAEMNALPEQALHVGDNLLSDIAGAHRVGMCTAWISGYDSREPEVEPDYVLEDLADLPAVVERWRTP